MDLNLVNNVIYTVTGQGCGGVPNLLYAINLENRKVTVSAPPQAGLWGTAGPAVGTDGAIYFESGTGPMTLQPGSFRLLSGIYVRQRSVVSQGLLHPQQSCWLSRRDLDMKSLPWVFPYKGRDLVVGSGKGGDISSWIASPWGGEPYDPTIPKRTYLK